MDFSYNSKRFRYFLGLSIESKLWSVKKQCIKSSANNSLELNKRLNHIAKKTINIYYELLNNDLTPSNSLIKEKLDSALKGSGSLLSFYDYVDEFIERSRNTKKANTISEYGYTLRDLKAFEKYSRRRIDWETLDMKFYDAYLGVWDVELGLLVGFEVGIQVILKFGTAILAYIIVFDVQMG